MKKNKLLAHPMFLLALFTLLINDFILKWEYHNWLTGKLSDFAGLIVAPIFLFIIFPKIKTHSIFVIGLFFIFWKSPFSQSMIDFVNQLSSFHFHRVVDYSDLIALPILSVPYFLIQKNNTATPFLFLKKINPSIFIFLLTSFALFSTSRAPRDIPQGDIYLNDSFNVKKSVEEVLNKIEQNGYLIKNDTTQTWRKAYLYIEDFAFNNRSVDTIKFNVYQSSKRKTTIHLINISFKEEYHEQNWKHLRRESRYYKRQIKRELKRIISEK